MDMIDADRVMPVVQTLLLKNKYARQIEESLWASVVDAVPVVRCKDCKHFINLEPCDPCECMKWTVKWGRAYVEPNDFCSYGEKRCDDEV